MQPLIYTPLTSQDSIQRLPLSYRASKFSTLATKGMQLINMGISQCFELGLNRYDDLNCVGFVGGGGGFFCWTWRAVNFLVS